jgi:hypothetical protein
MQEVILHHQTILLNLPRENNSWEESCHKFSRIWCMECWCGCYYEAVWIPPLQAILPEGHIKDLMCTRWLGFQEMAEAVRRASKTGDGLQWRDHGHHIATRSKYFNILDIIPIVFLYILDCLFIPKDSFLAYSLHTKQNHTAPLACSLALTATACAITSKNKRFWNKNNTQQEQIEDKSRRQQEHIRNEGHKAFPR